MRSPEGVDYRRGGIYREIVEPERHGDKTKVTFRQTRFTQAASRDRHREGRVKRLERLAG